MIGKIESQLLQEIESFNLWSKTADKSYGEWETDYLHWDRIYKYSYMLINKIPVENWSSELLNKFIYILARDNECESIIYELIEYPNQLIAVAKHAISFPDFEARWQIAYALGEIIESRSEIQILLQNFLADEEEYVRRRASFAYEKKGY